MESAAEQLPNRLAESLTLDVPQRDVDPAHGVDADPAASGIDVFAVHLVPEVFGLKRVFADEQLAQAGL